MKTVTHIKSISSWLVFSLLLFTLTSSGPSRIDVTQKPVIRLGIILLTDCAPLVMAKELGLFKKYGVNVEVSKEASWANVRDKILTSELDSAHCLMSMPLSVYTGVGGKAGSEMKIALVLNNKGQAITVSKDFCGKVGFKQTSKVAPVVTAKLKADKEVTFAMTFPGGKCILPRPTNKKILSTLRLSVNSC